MTKWLTKSQEERIFHEAKNGFGFEEVEQTGDGLYCEGCMTVHKRPTKMYNQPGSGRDKDKWCRSAVVHFFNPEDQ